MSLTNRARLLCGSPLSRPRTAVPIIIGLAVIIAFGVSAYIRELSPVKPVGLQIYFIALAASLLLSLVPLAILWFLDRREPESRWLYLIAVFWGAIIAFEIADLIHNSPVLDVLVQQSTRLGLWGLSEHIVWSAFVGMGSGSRQSQPSADGGSGSDLFYFI